MSKRSAEDMWQKFEYFSGYGFNKSHAVAYSMVSYQCAWLATYYNAEWACAFLDKEPESRKEAAINIAKSWGYKIIPLNINTSGRRWTAQDETTLIAPLTTIKGLGDAAIDEIIEKRPFASVEQLLFDGGVVARKLNKKALDALCRAGAMHSLMDDRFTGDKHFWSAVVVDKPKNKKKLGENIESYRPEGSFTNSERIQNIQTLTGIYPINMVLNDRAKGIIDNYMVPPISEYDADLGAAWCIPIRVNQKKSKNGKWFYIIDVIDSNSEMTKIRCWGVNPSKDHIFLNKPYVLKYPKYNETWGFSTYGAVDKKWMMIG
jgi:DNA polymerase III alpha subunit